MSPTRRTEEIWDTAEKLFSQYGYHATTMRRIASELGLEGGSLYAHIESKEEVLRAVIRRAGDQFLQTLEPIASSDAPPADKLRTAIRAHVRLVADDLDAATVYFHEWRFLQPKYRGSVLQRRDAYEQMFRKIITEGIEAGVFRDYDRKFATILILSACNWLYHWYDLAGPLSPEEIADLFTDMILEGLLK
ncbi:MAG: TetR/AcrR family transcriptional regulator [Anaerolineae bacterium]